MNKAVTMQMMSPYVSVLERTSSDIESKAA
jgi:hypothetical protein